MSSCLKQLSFVVAGILFICFFLIGLQHDEFAQFRPHLNKFTAHPDNHI